MLPWQERRSFQPESDEGEALLGTPSGYGVLWMLLRQPALRHLTVKRVCVFGRWASGRVVAALYTIVAGPHLYIELGDRPTRTSNDGQHGEAGQ